MRNRPYTKKNFIRCILSIFIFCIGITCGWYWRIWYAQHQPSKLTEIREDNANYKYINPLLLVEATRTAPEYNRLKKIVADYANSEKLKNNASSISVYFRDLNSGKWTGVDEDILYEPSSLLKVAVMVGYLKTIDTNPPLLLKKLPYIAEVDPGQNYKPEHPLKAGNYTVEDLLKVMIVDSDNNALNTLYDNDSESFVTVFKNLEISPPPAHSTVDFMSPKKYSGIFRILYSATYLPKNISEQALQLLTYTNFKKGLVAGVPEKIIVAHKFGEHTTVAPDNVKVISRELHDCGIIYYPEKPYLLCVMTKGQDFSTLENIISTISNIVYKNIPK